MAICGKCGNETENESNLCSVCKNSYSPVKVVIEEQNDLDVEQNKGMAILAYLNILVLIPFIMAPNSRFVRFHVNQGLIITITTILYAIGTKIVVETFSIISYKLGGIISSIFSFGNIVLLILIIIGVINVFKGEMKEVPYIGHFRIIG